MKVLSIIGFLVFLLFMAGSASADSLHIEQEASCTDYKAGDKIYYEYKVTNRGTEDITDLQIIDNMGSTISLGDATLKPGESVERKEIYVADETDVERCYVANQVHAEGQYLKDDRHIESDPDTHIIPAERTPLTITKSADPASYSVVGDDITYTYTVKNTGTSPIKVLKIIDDKLGTVFDSSFILSPGSSVEATATYAITQEDITAGLVTNTAYAIGS